MNFLKKHISFSPIILMAPVYVAMLYRDPGYLLPLLFIYVVFPIYLINVIEYLAERNGIINIAVKKNKFRFLLSLVVAFLGFIEVNGNGLLL